MLDKFLMSSKNNTIYKKTSFLAGNNSELLKNFMLIIFQILIHYQRVGEVFEGLSDDEKIVYKDLKGPSWSPEKNLKLKSLTEIKNMKRKKYQI